MSYNTPTKDAQKLMQEFDKRRKSLTLKDLEELPIAISPNPGRARNPFDRSKGGALVDKYLAHSQVYWPAKVLTAPPENTTSGFDLIRMKPFAGVNFATQDYMGLSNHPQAKQAAIDAIKKYGTHSGGSPLFFGRHALYEDCVRTMEEALSPLFKPAHVNIFSTGWLAGHASIKGKMTSFIFFKFSIEISI